MNRADYLMSVQHNVSKFSSNHKHESAKRTEASEETNDSSSDEGADEFHGNKVFKPKPGKLDLSQFDNITNAIGKLKVQAPIRLSEINTGPQPRAAAFQSHHKTLEEELPYLQYSSFFKSKTKKQTKNRVKESPQRGKSSPGNNNKDLEDTRLSPSKRRSGGNSSFEEEKFEQKNRSNSTPSSSSFHAQKNIYPGPSLDHPSLNLDRQNDKDPPKPAPRTSHSSIANKPISPQLATTSSASNVAAGSVLSTKRVSNHRQNHGRAVAPPQLPDDIRLTTSSKSRVDSERPSHAVISKISGDDGSVDFSQSPIAQRLLRHTKDYKVSELNSPYESDCDHPQSSVNLIRVQKLQRGQSFISENNSPVYANSCIDSSELINSRGAAIRQLNEILANKQAPGRPGGQKLLLSRGASTEQEHNFLDDQLSKTIQQQSQSALKDDKDLKKEKKKSRDDEKLEKRRLKEEERVRRQEKKLAAKRSSKHPHPDSQVDEDGVPVFIRRCIEFIEYVGLDAEGIYRVPGNRAHVDAFVQKFKEDINMSIADADIPVNAVATALKDFLSKKWGPIIPQLYMTELTDLSNISDKTQRVQALRQLVNKLPPPNYRLLKYVFSHFVKVSLNHPYNSMDSKNLAICWWPTLLPLSFSDMVMFEQMRPHLEETVQTMIDQYDYIFDSDESL